MSTLATQEIRNNVISSNVIKSFTAFLDVAPSTVRSYSSGLKMFAKFLASHEIKNPTRECVVAFKKELEALGRKPSTIALYLSALRRFFTWTESNGIYKNITAGVKTPKLSKGHKKDCFSGVQVKNILSGIDRSTVEGLRNYAVMALMSCGGLRTVEITRANVEDLRVINGVTVLYIQGKGKTDKADFVKLPPQVEKAVREYLNARGQADMTAPLFVSESKRNKGHGLTTRTISGIAKNAMINAGFNSSRLTAHSLRHTAITLSIMAGANLPEVQAFARHSSINTTMIYNHAVNRFNSICENSIAREIF